MSEEMEPSGAGREIAVIGMAGRFPGARDLRELWRNLRGGVEAIRPFADEELLAAGIPAERLADPRYVKAGSVLDGADRFDAGFFGYSAREAEILDPQQRLFLEHAWEALEDAGYTAGGYEGLIGVYAGVAWNTYLLSNLTSNRELFDGGGGFQVFIANDKDFMPTRVSYKLNLKGPSLVVQTSCSTSLVAIHLACLSLLNYECDMALVGGVTVKVPQVEGYWYLDGGLASPDGHCRAFDARAAGTVFGSGAGMVVLKRLADARADGDTVRAVVKGSAINNDGSLKVSYTAPSVEGQAEVIAAAQAVAGVEPDTIGYVETHGTGTSLGDPIEVTALTKVFRDSTERRGFCALGSIKSNLGHLDAAAGIAGFIKAVLALENREIPPSLHFERPNPAIDFAGSPFYVNAALAPWEADGAPRRAGVSSFGVGGTNAHVILEEAPPAEEPAASRPWQLLLLSARSEAALEAATERLIERLREEDAPALPDVAYTLQAGRAVFRHRRALVCRDREDALAALEARDPERVLTAVDLEDPRDRTVVVSFPARGVRPRVLPAEGLGEVAAACVEGALSLEEALDRAALPGEAAAELLADPRTILLEFGAEAAGRSDGAVMLEALGRLWLAGLRIDWTGYRSGERRRRVPLPTYPFERQRYWIEPRLLAPAAEPRVGKLADVSGWFYAPAWKPAALPAGTTGPARLLVLATPGGPSARLAEHLAAGREVIAVEPAALADAGGGFRRLGERAYAVHLRQPGAWESLLADLRSQDRLPDAVVHAWGLDPAEPVDSVEGFEAAQERGFHALLGLARALERQGSTAALTVVASGLFALTPEEELRPEKATMLGLCKVLPQEMPGLTCRAVDATASVLPGLLAAEVLAETGEERVACRGGRRWLPAWEPVRLDPPVAGGDGAAPPPLRDHGVYLLTGGLENNGYGLARWLARAVRARLVLIEEGEADAGRVRALEELGAEVLVLTADLADGAALRAAVDRAETRFGALHGVVHAAGTMGERTFRLIRELDREACGWHFRPKAHALYALERALQGREPDFCVVLSSLATVLGGVAYAAYTAANLFADAFVQDHNRDHNRRGGAPWLALGWDVWQMEAGEERITAVREDLVELAMAPAEGEEAFRRAAAARGFDQLLVSTASLPERVAESVRRIGSLQERAADRPAAARHPRPQLQTPYAAPETDLERRIAEVWQRALGFEAIGAHDNFFELGGDSFVAVQMVSRLQDELGVDLPVARLYQGLTIRSLAALLARGECAAADHRAAPLEERRESMGRRRELMERRRSSKKGEAV